MQIQGKHRWLLATLAVSIALAGVACSDRRAAGEPPTEEAVALIAPVESPVVESPMMAEPPPPPVDVGMVGGADQVKGLSNRNGSQLAYQHDVTVRIGPSSVAGNLARTREACVAQKFGQCEVLGEQLEAGEVPSGQLSMRAVPDAVSPLVGMAANGGKVAERRTSAEDLAEAVRDNGLRRKRLELQHAKLSEILSRRDAKVADLLTVTQRLAEIEAEMQQAEQEAAQQQRRITTNRLTVHFEAEMPAISIDQPSQIGQALRGLTRTWDASIAFLITTLVGGLLPVLLLLGFAVWLLLKLRRRRSARA
jgi:hypothetical protein